MALTILNRDGARSLDERLNALTKAHSYRVSKQAVIEGVIEAACRLYESTGDPDVVRQIESLMPPVNGGASSSSPPAPGRPGRPTPTDGRVSSCLPPAAEHKQPTPA